jgi:hypothetical protein
MIPGTDVTVPTASRLYCQVTKIHIHTHNFTAPQLHSAEGEEWNRSKDESGGGETNFTTRRLANWTSKLCPVHLQTCDVSCADTSGGDWEERTTLLPNMASPDTAWYANKTARLSVLKQTIPTERPQLVDEF